MSELFLVSACNYCAAPADTDEAVALSTLQENLDFCSKKCAMKHLLTDIGKDGIRCTDERTGITEFKRPACAD